MITRRPILGLVGAWIAGTILSQEVPGLALPAVLAMTAAIVAWFAVPRRFAHVLLIAAACCGAVAWSDPAWTRHYILDPLADAAGRKRTDIEAVVTGDPDIEPLGPAGGCLTFPVRVTVLNGIGVPHGVRERLAVCWYGNVKHIAVPGYGELWRFTGRVDRRRRSIRGARYTLTTNAERSACVRRGAGAMISQWLFRLRGRAARQLTLGIETHPVATGMIQALLLGYRSRLSPELQQLFARTGTMHIFAISGLHVGIIAWLLLVLLTAAGVPRTRWAWAVIPLLGAYTLVTGMKPSAVRATAMASTYVLAAALRRKTDPFSALALAALLILLFRPAEIGDIGFIMSFTVVLGILLLYPHVMHVLGPLWKPDPFRVQEEPWYVRGLRGVGAYVGALVGLSVAAWLASAPISMAVFHRFTPVALLANLVAVPLTFLIVLAGFLSLTLGSVLVWAADIFNHAALSLIGMLIGLMRGLAAIPGSCIHVAVFPWWGLCLWYGALLAGILYMEGIRPGPVAADLDET